MLSNLSLGELWIELVRSGSATSPHPIGNLNGARGQSFRARAFRSVDEHLLLVVKRGAIAFGKLPHTPQIFLLSPTMTILCLDEARISNLDQDKSL